MVQELVIIPAKVSDLDFIYQSLRDMAKEEGVLDRFSQTKHSLEKFIFHNQTAEVMIAYQDTIPVGLVMFSVTHRNFNLFEKSGIYVHDLYVVPSFRHHGIATNLLSYLRKLAKERNLGRIDLVVFKDNLPAIKFYQTLHDMQEVDYIKYMRIKIDD